MSGHFGKLSRRGKDRKGGSFDARLAGIAEAPASLRQFTAPQFLDQFTAAHV